MSDLISRQAAIDVADAVWSVTGDKNVAKVWDQIKDLPSAQPDIKQATKLLLDFIKSCPGGDSYLITPDGEELRTDWGYTTDGIQLIHDWAERRIDG